MISPSELRNRRERDLKRTHVQAAEGMREIVEVYQDDYACHIHRREDSGRWSFELLNGADAVLRLESVGIEITLAEIYEFAPRPGEDRDAEA